ncbi:DUF4298 domain-containing protein [Streptococcus pluranimalium]
MIKQDKIDLPLLESTYHESRLLFKNLSDSLTAFEEHYSDYLTLRNFYGSDEWYQAIDHNSNNDLQLDILSEDLLYDLIVEHNRFIERFLDLTTTMYKNL